MKQDHTNVLHTVDEKIKELEEKERHWAALEAAMEENIAHAAEQITLNIGMRPLLPSFFPSLPYSLHPFIPSSLHPFIPFLLPYPCRSLISDLSSHFSRSAY